MMTDPLVYGVRMCRRASSAAVNSRVLNVDAASTQTHALRTGQSTSPAASVPANPASGGCLRACVAMLRRGGQQRATDNAVETYTAVMSSVQPTHGSSASKRGRSPVYCAIRLRTIPPSPVDDGNVEEPV